jgi:hypothetical protein
MLFGWESGPDAQSPQISAHGAQVTDFKMNDWLKAKIAASVDELSKERDCVGHLTGAAFAACEIVEDTMLPGEN